MRRPPSPYPSFATHHSVCVLPMRPCGTFPYVLRTIDSVARRLKVVESLMDRPCEFVFMEALALRWQSDSVRP